MHIWKGGEEIGDVFIVLEELDEEERKKRRGVFGIKKVVCPEAKSFVFDPKKAFLFAEWKKEARPLTLHLFFWFPLGVERISVSSPSLEDLREGRISYLDAGGIITHIKVSPDPSTICRLLDILTCNFPLKGRGYSLCGYRVSVEGDPTEFLYQIMTAPPQAESQVYLDPKFARRVALHFLRERPVLGDPLKVLYLINALGFYSVELHKKTEEYLKEELYRGLFKLEGRLANRGSLNSPLSIVLKPGDPFWFIPNKAFYFPVIYRIFDGRLLSLRNPDTILRVVTQLHPDKSSVLGGVWGDITWFFGRFEPQIILDVPFFEGSRVTLRFLFLGQDILRLILEGDQTVVEMASFRETHTLVQAPAEFRLFREALERAERIFSGV